MLRPLTCTTIAILLLSLAGCVDSIKAHKTINLSVEHLEGSALDVDTRNGWISIVASDEYEEVSIESKVQCAGSTLEEAESRVAEATISTTRDSSGRLLVKPIFPGSARSGDGATVKIYLPDAHGVVADTSNGSIIVHGTTGPVEVDTSNGSISAGDNRGTLTIDTSNGPVTVTDHEGDVWIDTSNGAIRIERLNGNIEADTSNGTITVEDLAGSANLDTSNGSIRVWLREDQSAPLYLDTSNGGITINLGSGFAGEFSLRTSNSRINIRDSIGAIRNQWISRNRAQLTIGEGGPQSRASTSNGGITLTIAE